MKLKSIRHILSPLVISCLGTLPVFAQSEKISGEMKTIAASLETAKTHLSDPSRKQTAIDELTRVKEASERAQKLEPTAANKANGPEKDAVNKKYRLNLQLMIGVVKAAATATELDQPQTALDLLKTLDPMTKPAHSQPYK